MRQVRGPLDPVHFHTAAEVMAWTPDSVSPLMVATVPLARRKAASAVQMLAGLDNGDWTYWTEFDANPQGGPRGNVYNFPYWQYVDAVYYYVHETVAVPPTVWTNAAHRNGVKMYAAVTGDCDTGCGDQVNKLFDDPGAADQLYRLAATFGFDGWMIDIERGALASPKVAQALSDLRARRLPNGQLVEAGYYEAFQYTINDHTFPFFEAGTFFQSDYSRANGYPKQSYDCLAKHGQADARFRTFWSALVNQFYSPDNHIPDPDRLCNGFGCLNITKFFALLAQARMPGTDDDYYQSIGIYGPDWTMYAGHEKNTDPLPSRGAFHTTDRLFWVGSDPILAHDGTLKTSRPAVSNFIPARTTLVAKPFVTRFNTGEGDFFAVSGRYLAAREWNHLTSQDRLPTHLLPIEDSATTVATVGADYSYAEAYDGGSSLTFSGPLAPGQRVEYLLYTSDISLQEATRATFTYKLLDTRSLAPYLKLMFSDETWATVWDTGRDGWVPASTIIGARSGSIVSVCVGFVNDTQSPAIVKALVGEVRVIASPSTLPPSLITPDRTGDLLSWTPPADEVWYYNVVCQTSTGLTLVGRTVVPGYDLSAALFPADGTYAVQPVTTSGESCALPPG